MIGEYNTTPRFLAPRSTLILISLFLPPTSDDLSHDEALSSRIAALNMLDLDLEHLDVNIGNAAERELDAVVKACGESESRPSQLIFIVRLG
jgi:hypothetical protein